MLLPASHKNYWSKNWLKIEWIIMLFIFLIGNLIQVNIPDLIRFCIPRLQPGIRSHILHALSQSESKKLNWRVIIPRTSYVPYLDFAQKNYHIYVLFFKSNAFIKVPFSDKFRALRVPFTDDLPCPFSSWGKHYYFAVFKLYYLQWKKTLL